MSAADIALNNHYYRHHLHYHHSYHHHHHHQHCHCHHWHLRTLPSTIWAHQIWLGSDLSFWWLWREPMRFLPWLSRWWWSWWWWWWWRWCWWWWWCQCHHSSRDRHTCPTRSSGVRGLNRCCSTEKTRTSIRYFSFEKIILKTKNSPKKGQELFLSKVNFSAFHSMYDVETPLCSARW